MKAYMFPGQGSQYKGMGEDLFDEFSAEAEEASNILSYDVKAVCLENSGNMLSHTEYTQPCLYFVNCLAYLSLLKHKAGKPDFLCGHSLGEYSALFAAGVFDLSTGLRIVQKRGELMSEVLSGSLLAVLGENVNSLYDILNFEEGLSNIDFANYNSSEQVVVGGNKDDLFQAKDVLEKRGFRCIELDVSGPFHTRYMASARIKFMRYLMDFAFKNPVIPVLSSATCEFFQNKYSIETLGFQITKPVLWVQVIKKLMSLGVSSFLEIGPGEVLTKLAKKITLDYEKVS